LIPSDQLVFQESKIQLAMWESRRKSLELCTGEFVWPIGDDDLISLSNLGILHKNLKNLDTELLLLNGEWNNYAGKSGNLSRTPKYNKDYSSQSELLRDLNTKVNSMDLGRFVASRELNKFWINQPGTIEETWHEEYRALYNAIDGFITFNKTIKVKVIPEPLITLGSVEKSWSSNFFKARFGEVRMLETLPNSYSPNNLLVAKKLRKYLESYLHLISCRVRGIWLTDLENVNYLSNKTKRRIKLIGKIHPEKLTFLRAYLKYKRGF
jgi:hypothetical protein